MQAFDPNANGEDQEPSPSSAGDPPIVPDEAKTTQQKFDEIVAQLSDLSTNTADQKTAPPSESEKTADNLSFPTAPWVTGPRIEPPNPQDWADQTERESSWDHPGASPRDWDDDDEILQAIDRFVPGDPGFELSRDPVRNVGWFLTLFGGLALLFAAIFMRPMHPPTMVILAAMFLGGLGLLIWRMPSGRDGHDRDSGAVV